MKKILITMIAAAPLALSACATNQGVQGAGIGAGVGAVAGAVIGNNVGSGNAETGALIGAGVGAPPAQPMAARVRAVAAITPIIRTIPNWSMTSIPTGTTIPITGLARHSGRMASRAPARRVARPAPNPERKGRLDEPPFLSCGPDGQSPWPENTVRLDYNLLMK